MKNTRKKKSKEAWDKRELGASVKHARKASSSRENALDERLGLQSISIRLHKNLITSLKKLADEDGIGYQPYVRQILMRYVRRIDLERGEKLKHEKHAPKSR